MAQEDWMIGFTSALKDFGVLQSGSESSESLEQASQVKTEKNRMSLAFFMMINDMELMIIQVTE